MTQVKSAQESPSQLALRKRADARSLAQRRAGLEAQIRDMAISDLAQVSTRLKGLHKELEQQDGRRWTHYELADAMKIPPRTFQSWENGEVENRDGEGYKKMARWYSRKLGRKITKRWIVFGDEEAPPESDLMAGLNAATPDAGGVERLADELVSLRAQLLSELAAMRKELEVQRTLIAQIGHGEEESGS